MVGIQKELNDVDLIEKIKNGDDHSYSILVSRYKNIVAKTVLSMLGDSVEADDVGQEVFIRFYRSIADFRGDSSLSTYLTRIAINLSLNELKRRKRRNLFIFSPKTDKERVIPEIVDQNDTFQKSDVNELIEKALAMLDPKFSAVVVLRMIQGLSVKETAEVLNLPQGTVLSRLSRAQDRLKIILKSIIK